MFQRIKRVIKAFEETINDDVLKSRDEVAIKFEEYYQHNGQRSKLECFFGKDTLNERGSINLYNTLWNNYIIK